MKAQIPNMLCAVGITLITIGLWQTWQPLAFLGSGALLCVFGVLMYRTNKKEK